MKKQLLILGMGLLGTLTSWAQLSSPYQGAQAPTEGSGDFYLYNVKTGKWLENNSTHDGAGWTTRGELGSRGLDVEVIFLTSDGDETYYQLNPKFNGNHSINYNNLYLDTPDAVTQWGFEDASDSGISNAVRIWANAGEYPYLHADDEGWLVCDLSGEGKSENEIWQLVTREERLDYMVKNATPDNGMDATWLIGNPDFANANQRDGKWVKNCSKDGHDDIITHGPVQAVGGGNDKQPFNVQEFWSTWSASMTQTIKNIPNGTYKFGVQGYYREGSGDTRDFNEGDQFAYDLYSTGKETHPALYYANSASAPLLSIFASAKDANETGFEHNAYMHDPDFGDVIQSGKWIPNSTGMAGKAFFYNPDAYQNADISASVADGTITIGIKKDKGANDDWVIVDNFRLTYYGSQIDLTQVKEGLQQALAAAEACTLTSTEAINKMYADAVANGKDVLANSTSAEEIAAATTAINDAVALLKATSENAGYLSQVVALCKTEGVTGDAMTVATDVVVNGVENDAINKALNDLRLARRINALERHPNVFTGSTPQAGESYYLYNVGQQRFFCGGESWGAHAALGYPGIAVILEAVDGKEGFKIDTRLQNADGQHYLNWGGYCDCATDDMWNFEKFKDGVYNISRIWENETVYLGYRPGTYATVDTDMKGADVADNQWILVTKAERDALLEQATEDSPVDASYLIKMPNFNQREYQITGGWDNTSAEVFAWEHVGGSIWGRGQDKPDFAFECWNDDPVVLTQTIKDMLPGYYILGVQGYYRDCTESEYCKLLEAGDYVPQQLAELEATTDNGETRTFIPLTTIDKGANKLPGEGWNSNTSVGRMPNDPGQACSYFQVGQYKNSMIVKVGDDGVMSIGISKMGGTEKDWVCVDNFRLTYLGETEPTGIDGITENATAKDGKIYNLQGVQVKTAGQRGIYIQNGKKFVVK